MPTKDIAKIHGAAFYFAHFTQNLQEIANKLQVSARTIRRYAEEPEWDKALDSYGYTGDRNFDKQKTRDTQRDNGLLYIQAVTTYARLREDGIPKHKLITMTSKEMGLPRDRIYTWARKNNWETEGKHYEDK